MADQHSTWLPFGDRTPALAPLIRSSTSSWTPRRPALTQRLSILSLPLSRDSDGESAIAIAAESFASSSRPRLASERLHVRLELLHLIHPLVGRDIPEVSRISRVAVVRFTPVATPTPANLAAAPSLPSYFPQSRVRVCLGLACGSCHAIPALVPPLCGNTAVAPPR